MRMRITSGKREFKVLRHIFFRCRGWSSNILLFLSAIYTAHYVISKLRKRYRPEVSLTYNATGHNILSDAAAMLPTMPSFAFGNPNISTPEDKLEWSPPDSIHAIYNLNRESENAKYYTNYSFLRPIVYLGYAIPRVQPAGHYQLLVYSSGVNMGTFKRGFEVAGCMVGNEVHHVEYSEYDATVCYVNRRVEPGEKISLVLLKNDKLKEALKGPVDLGRGAFAKLEPGDVMEMPKDTSVQLYEEKDPSTMMYIRSREGAQVDGRLLEDMPSEVRYEICAATQTKLYPHLLKDWVDYHRRIGVDMFYIVDNDSENDPSSLFEGRKDVEVIYWPWERSQIQLFTYFLQMGKSRCEWMLLFDSDEWVMVGIGKNHEFAGDKPLKQYIDKHKDGFHGIEFRFLVMGPSGQVKIPDQPVPEAYIHFSKEDDSRHGKVIVKCDVEFTHSGLHWAHTRWIRAMYYRTEQQFNKYPQTVDDDACIVHYRYRSFEDTVIRGNSKSSNFGDNRNLDVAVPGGMEGMPPSWTNVNDSMKYTYFRDIWRSITKSNGLDEQSLVRTIGQRRCVRKCKILGAQRECYVEQCGEIFTM